MFQVSKAKDNVYFNQFSEYNTQSFIPQKHIESHQHSFVTALSANHMPTEAEEKSMSTLIHKLKETDSISQSKKLTHEIKQMAKQLADDIQWMRNHYFTVENDGTDRVYGRMADGYTDFERDGYIRALVHYYQCENELSSLPNNLNFSIIKMVAPHHSGRVYGDIQALTELAKGKSANLPDLTYNRGSLQFG
ncbi:NleF caspase inhibitor [Providencia rettgeri]|uniref:NleF caspase inhibitor n=1 Tax=Providencia rettgeri TaxID=587 RepID=UPI0034E09AA4